MRVTVIAILILLISLTTAGALWSVPEVNHEPHRLVFEWLLYWIYWPGNFGDDPYVRPHPCGRPPFAECG